MDIAKLNLRDHGAQHVRGALGDALANLRDALAHLPRDHAGLRIRDEPALRPFLTADGPIGSIAVAVLGLKARAVRAILFDKTADINWSLAWHQDRTICVKQKVEVDGFGPWTVKGGTQHVAPPFHLLASMITLRVHIDDVPAGNAPLLIAPGSHSEGRVPIDAIEAVADRCGTVACLADAGDVWVYATPILHASEAAIVSARRRVLQVDYAAVELPGGLEWLGV